MYGNKYIDIYFYINIFYIHIYVFYIEKLINPSISSMRKIIHIIYII